jgi:hypothetical protein
LSIEVWDLPVVQQFFHNVGAYESVATSQEDLHIPESAQGWKLIGFRGYDAVSSQHVRNTSSM